ncbi:MAG: SDR family oxidoreductase [Gammaproteobacteria bacterium]|nr:SDR family oxidoreductase [Gammaproteobacteria bacterium]
MRGKVILITGGTSGIGLAVAQRCAIEGAAVVIAARNKRESVVEELTALGGVALMLEVDVADETGVQSMIEATLERFGRLDYAFNSAGTFAPEPDAHEHDSATWRETMSVYLDGTYYCMKHQLRAMLDCAAPCAIVNNASTVGLRGSLSAGAGYTAAKHGVIGLTRQIAVEYAKTNVRINAVCPGPTQTPATAPLLKLPESELSGYLASLNPTAALVPTEEIAETVMFLCSDRARMINGQALGLDGGQLAQL